CRGSSEMMSEDRGNAVGAMRSSNILRDGDAVQRGLGDVPAVDRDRGPAQAPVGARHGRKHMRADRLVGIADRDRNLNGRLRERARRTWSSVPMTLSGLDRPARAAKRARNTIEILRKQTVVTWLMRLRPC